MDRNIEAIIFNKIDTISLIVYVLFSYICLLSMKSYKTLWYYSGLCEIQNVAKALTLSICLFTIYFSIILKEHFSIIFLILLWMISLSLVIAFRLIWILRKESVYSHVSPHKRTLIVGAGDAGTMVARQILLSKELDYTLIGFVDDNPMKQNMEIFGIPVLGTKNDIRYLIKTYRISDVIIAMPSVEKSYILDIVKICKQTSVHVKILPRVRDVIQGQLSVNEIREVNVKDLIGREIMKPTSRVNNYIRNKSVLITGAGGSIGSELVLQVAQYDPKNIILVGHGENSIFQIGMSLKEKFPQIESFLVIEDIQNKSGIEKVFNHFQPDIVFHAAAHKHVPLMEVNIEIAVRNNVFGTLHVAQAASHIGVERFVYISTDKAVYPINVMGMTKRIGELIIQQFSEKSLTKFSIVRFGNVLESRGSVIPIFKKQIEVGGPVTVTHPDMVRYFMTIPEAVQLVLEAGSLSNGGEVFVLDMGEPVKIVDIAKNLIRLSGFEPHIDIPIQFTGIRPGEKLKEDLFYEHEEIMPTVHPKIVIAIPKKKPNFDMEAYLTELEQLLFASQDQIRSFLSEMLQKNISSEKKDDDKK